MIIIVVLAICIPFLIWWGKGRENSHLPASSPEPPYDWRDAEAYAIEAYWDDDDDWPWDDD
tara:strand:- start:7563 stop:7745 length:183 start_codon:yes stop_codon:yes gene_type:complete